MGVLVREHIGSQLELVWVRDLGLTEAADLLGLLHPTTICAVKLEVECKQWHLLTPLIPRDFQKFPYHLAYVIGFVSGLL